MDISLVKQEYERKLKLATDAKGKNDYVLAKKFLGEAMQSLMTIIDNSTGEARETYAKRFDAYVEVLKQYNARIQKTGDTQTKNIEQKIFSQLPASAQGGGKRGEDDGLTDFKEATVPDISFDDVAGLQEVKDAVYKAVIQPQENKELYQKFGVDSGGGILMYGLPGTGKTMIAKAIAHELNAAFYAVKCSDIVGRYFGDSERNLSKLFETARKQDRAVIFFDEIEAIAAKRDTKSSVMQRVVPEFLAQIQGFDSDRKDKTLLLLAATNRPWDIDSAFMRPGRFDTRVKVGLPDYDARRYIIEHKLSKAPHNLSEKDIDNLSVITEGFNGADVDNFVKQAKQIAIERCAALNNNDQFVTRGDFAEAIKSVKSSVQTDDIQKLIAWEAKNTITQ